MHEWMSVLTGITLTTIEREFKHTAPTAWGALFQAPTRINSFYIHNDPMCQHLLFLRFYTDVK